MEFLEGESHRPNSIALRANRFSSFIGRENNNVSFDLLFRFDDTTVSRTVTTYSVLQFANTVTFSNYFSLFFFSFVSFVLLFYQSGLSWYGEEKSN